MTYSRKQVVTTISVVYLILVTALAGYAASFANKLSLPIPDGLAHATTVLPIVSGLLLQVGYDLTRRQERRKRLNRGEIQRPPLVIIANTLIFIYSTVVITLLGTYAAPPSGLDCGLRERWETLYRHKYVEAVRTIQDAFMCCGFKNSRDMAWPFPDKTHKATACEEAFGHTNGCLGPWKSEEQRMAGILMAVVALVFMWQVSHYYYFTAFVPVTDNNKFAIIAIPTQRETWLHSVVPDRVSRMIADEEHTGNDGPHRAIDYLPNFNQYSDRVEEDNSDGDVENGARKAIESSTEHAENVFPGRSDDGGQERGPLENEWLRSSD
ncbi:uncharacterized protein N0V89_004035 [Didymosphaeria variabile]|uniref:Tetraspanin Tsp3 n=1 Tax=Didymosphaeria variabile TaxID=1932322 RepID=A0A9W8XPH1_9PLEO|nr:uncharacterized protein N0V89_004035 [Didymosphaeria variabile]KAJ4356009.1 hypothetical protein N0V89_004035 [Didymosphaeria variabile]